MSSRELPRICLLASRETAPSILFGLYDVLSTAGITFEELVSGEAGTPALDVRIVAATAEPFRCVWDVLVEPACRIDEVAETDAAVVCDMYVPVTESPINRIDRAADLSTVPQASGEETPLRVFLLHTPDQFAWACAHDADLVLAGHTHGGQVRFPVLGAVACPSLYGTRYAGGVFRRGPTVMHVTRGLGGKTPIRVNCPPEAALLRLAVGTK